MTQAPRQPHLVFRFPLRAVLAVVSKNTNELKTGAPGRFGLEVSTLGSPIEARILVMRTPMQPLTWLVVAIAGWIQRDQQAA